MGEVKLLLGQAGQLGEDGVGAVNYTHIYTHIHSCLPTHLITKVHLSLCGHI